MDSRTETYTKRSSMKIDSLLNPPTDAADRDYPTGSPFSQHATMPSSSHASYPHFPDYLPSPSNGYWYGTSLSTTSTATTTVRSPTGSSSASLTPQHHHNHHDHHQQHHHQLQHHTFMSYHPPGSTHSSPDPYHPRERYDSVSSSSSTNGAPNRRRPPRPKYEEEEMYFIWYHRVDLCQEWKEVRESFNRQFPERQRRGFQGIQCKFYRFIKEKKCPTLREQRRMRDGEFLRDGAALGDESGAPKFGVVEWANVWYPWMREGRETVLRQQRIMT